MSVSSTASRRCEAKKGTRHEPVVSPLERDDQVGLLELARPDVHRREELQMEGAWIAAESDQEWTHTHTRMVMNNYEPEASARDWGTAREGSF